VSERHLHDIVRRTGRSREIHGV